MNTQQFINNILVSQIYDNMVYYDDDETDSFIVLMKNNHKVVIDIHLRGKDTIIEVYPNIGMIIHADSLDEYIEEFDKYPYQNTATIKEFFDKNFLKEFLEDE